MGTLSIFFLLPELLRQNQEKEIFSSMEAYGVALSSSLKGIPCYAVKIITDLIGNHVNLGTYGYTLRQLRTFLPEKVEEVLSAL